MMTIFGLCWIDFNRSLI